MADTDKLFHDLSKATGGRVMNSPFLEPDEAAALAARLRDRGVGVTLEGGFTGARRRVLTAYPEHIPEATTPLAAVYFSNVEEDDELRVALERAGVARDAIGDIVSHQDGFSVVMLASAAEGAAKVQRVGAAQTQAQKIDLSLLGGGSLKEQTVIVPSLRVDALGAKAFRVSREYFSKGIAGNKVRVNGKLAGKSSSADPGDEVYAEGLGRFTVLRLEGETKKGNLKVTVEIERN